MGKRTDIDGATGVVEIVRPDGRGPLVLVCEHASAAIPERHSDLGLSTADRFSHAAWDPGAADLARHLSGVLDAPLVLATVSRLVHDLNRPAGSVDAVPSLVERIAVPGNDGLDATAREARAAEVYHPFHAALARVLDAAGPGTALVTVHSFTPRWHGVPRTTEIGVLHDADPALAEAMLAAAPTGADAPKVDLNAPYSAADGVTHLPSVQGTARGLPTVMLEVRSDLIADAAGVTRIGGALAAMLDLALAGRPVFDDRRQRA